jgi:hypothetical protein
MYQYGTIWENMKQYGTILKTKKRLPWSPSLGALKNDPWLILPWLIYGE